MLKRAPRGGTYLLSRIRCAYAHAAEQGRIPDDFVFPTLGIKGAPQVRRKRAFADAELATFIRWLPRSAYSRTVRDALALVLFTGCRSGAQYEARNETKAEPRPDPIEVAWTVHYLRRIARPRDWRSSTARASCRTASSITSIVR